MIVTRAAQHSDAVPDRAAFADEVDDSLGAMPAGKLENLLDLVAVSDDAMVRADGEGEFHGVGIAVDDDQFSRAVVALSTCTPICPRPPAPIMTQR